MTESTPTHDPVPTDDALLASLSAALDAVDPVPAHVLAAARAAFTWRTIDAELAELAFDSAEQALGVRSTDVNRQLTFRAPGVEIELMVAENGTRRLVGQLIPPTLAEVELVGSDSVVSVTADHLGRFTFDELTAGPARLIIRGDDGSPLVQTEWMLF